MFLDFPKAFDRVNHEIMLEKLHHYGEKGIRLNWFQANLTNWYQAVKLGQYLSEFQTITCGVIQGNVLGPFLFLISIWHLYLCLKNKISSFCRWHMYFSFLSLSLSLSLSLYLSLSLSGFLSQTFTIHRLTGQQGKGEAISLTWVKDITRVVIAESSPLYIASSRTQTGKLWFPSASRKDRFQPERDLNTSLDNISNRLKANKLTLNSSNVNEVIKTVLNFSFFFLQKDFTRNKKAQTAYSEQK